MGRGTKVQIWLILRLLLQRSKTKVNEPVCLLVISENFEEELLGANEYNERALESATIRNFLLNGEWCHC
jgi:hypothetical protein